MSDRPDLGTDEPHGEAGERTELRVKLIRGGGTAEYHVGPRAGKRRRERHRVHPHSKPRRLNAKDVQPRCGDGIVVALGEGTVRESASSFRTAVSSRTSLSGVTEWI